MVTKFGRILGSSVALSAVTSLATVFLNPTAAMGATLSTSEKEIDINGQSFMQPYGMVVGGTTYMPIWYVMQALKKAAIDSTWDGQNWHMTAANLQAKPNVGQGRIRIYVNNTLVYQVNGITHTDPASGTNTTYIPVYNIMQILKGASIDNTWDGHKWNIMLSTVDSSPSNTDSNTINQGSTAASIANFKGATNTPNQASDDTSYWSRASNDLYVSAQTYEPTSDGPGPTLLKLEPGQTVYLSALSHTRDVTDATWSVNSPAAHITAPAYTDWDFWEENHKTMSEATFVADKPGVYTIQAAANGEYSVPLVLIVGMDNLTGSPFSVSPRQAGIAALPASLPPMAVVNADGVSGITEYVPYEEQSDGWLPVKGKAASGAKSVVVNILGDDRRWNYMLPVNSDGTFGALLRVPLQSQNGWISIMSSDEYFKRLNNSQPMPMDGVYPLTFNGPLPSDSELGLLASAHMNYNSSSEFNQTASVLMDNSPSVETGIAAISNFVSDKITYDWNRANANITLWQPSTDAWSSNSGVCMDIAELTASMLRSIGLPTETIIGTAPAGAASDDHEWIKVQLGSDWLLADPTWNCPERGNDGTTDYVSSEYFTETKALDDSHTPDASVIGTWQ